MAGSSGIEHRRFSQECIAFSNHGPNLRSSSPEPQAVTLALSTMLSFSLVTPVGPSNPRDCGKNQHMHDTIKIVQESHAGDEDPRKTKCKWKPVNTAGGGKGKAWEVNTDPEDNDYSGAGSQDESDNDASAEILNEEVH